MPGPEVAWRGSEQSAALSLSEAVRALRCSGVEDAAMEGRRLMASVLGISFAQILSWPDRVLSAGEVGRLYRAVQRRCSGEPVSRIVGEQDFYGRRFTISSATLDPRPDSETLVEAALQLVREEGWQSSSLRILDVGTGSGCLLSTLICELPNATGVGTDISKDALEIARCNAERLAISERIEWQLCDALEGIEGRFQILVSNPPYVRTSDIAGLAPEVRDFDPVRALDGGPDGLQFYRRMVHKIRTVVPSGWVLFEVGHDQADDVAELLMLSSCRFPRDMIRFYPDVAGRRRCVAARTRS